MVALARAREYLREASARVEAFHSGGAAGLSTICLFAAIGSPASGFDC
ncbi:hypothetical protein D187_008218 [Cystobacter fuscus DSM 2262]|uniref:Uncharacterized protein n=1 Tax=Cystobacter fuscus (strain ATCC 25194 / DSM 2262 / NBRC 100088 / M29) TaxID=1242864 RepID=S9QHN7_CYSF2|nr:hypothetical protein [Cystobacter fuscus]EPX55963.1 hypothetical protein D187_008218 [Cystobacter fuscus DSM 2262]